MSSSNMTDDSINAANALNTMAMMFTRYWCVIMFILGLIGHSLSISVFTRPTLWSNPSIRYLTASSVAGYLVIFVILPLRLLQFGYNINLFVSSVIVCKLLVFLLSWIRILPCWFIAFASVDRYLCSSLSATVRGWSSIRVSKYIISLIIVLIGLTQIPTFIYFTVNAEPIICLGQPNLFEKLNAILLVIVWSIIPSLIMLIFGLLTIRHIQKSAQRITNQNNTNQRRRQTKLIDRQLIQIILIQSILFGLTSASGSIGGMFNVIDDNSPKDPLILAKQNLLTDILSFVGLLSPSISFYLCTLSSQLFRHQLLILFRLQRQDQVYPTKTILSRRQK